MRPRFAHRATAALVLCLLAATACSCAPQSHGTYAPALTGEPPSGQARAVLWFRGPAGDAVPICRTLEPSRAPLWAAIAALCAGPGVDTGLTPALPVGTELRRVVYWDGDTLPVGTVDLDFSAALGRPDTAQIEAISRTLSPFTNIRAARILVGGVPVTAAGGAGAAAALLVRPADATALMRYLPVAVGSRTCLAGNQITVATPSIEFQATAAKLIDTRYVGLLLPRGTKVSWNATETPSGRSVTVTVVPRKAKLDERDWAGLQIAADAIALTLRSIPGTATITVVIVGQDRTFDYVGPIWPNPDPILPSGS